MRALDLFCGDGGASMGLSRAGFEVIGVDHKPHPRYPFQFIQADAMEFSFAGYDFVWASPPCQKYTRLRFMPNYREHADLIAPVRKRLTESRAAWCIENVEDAPLGESGYLIVLCGTMFGLQTADGRAELRRHRLFETSFPILLRPACQHGRVVIGAYGDHPQPDKTRHAYNDRRAKVLTVVGHTPVDNAGRKTISVIGHSAPKFFDSRRRRAITVTGSTAQTNLITNRVRETFSVRDAQEAMGIDWMAMKGLSQAVPPAYAEFIAKRFLNTIAEVA
jgi:DNA (cytosine-5)-methyltransferase 1